MSPRHMRYWGKRKHPYQEPDLKGVRIMTVSNLTKKTGRSTHLKDESVDISSPLASELMESILSSGKPVTAWEAAASVVVDSTEQAIATLDNLTTAGILVRFRAGLNNYYATPKVALTEEEPLLRNIMSDSLKSLLLLWRYKMLGKLSGANTYYRLG